MIKINQLKTLINVMLWYISIGLFITFYIFLIYLWIQKDTFDHNDRKFADGAIMDLHKKLANGEDIPVITDEELREIGHDKILIIVVKDPQDSSEDGKESFMFYHPVNQRYWPNYYYSFPYTYASGGSWPPGMYSRLYNYTPGFNTSNWSYYLRPGMYYKRWGNNSNWLRKEGGGYYFVNNGTSRERPMDYMN
jgi:hypothetical protein